jgi:hypothetical protein
MNLELQLGTFSATIGILYQKGVRYGTVIDLGCADGTFYLQHFANGLLHGSTCVNVDANTLYEPSLREIQQLLGGHYVIAGVSDHDGEIELQSGSHPYWASSLPSDDPYWSGSHNRPGNAIKVRALTLDTLVPGFSQPPSRPSQDQGPVQGCRAHGLSGCAYGSAQACAARTECTIARPTPRYGSTLTTTDAADRTHDRRNGSI